MGGWGGKGGDDGIAHFKKIFDVDAEFLVGRAVAVAVEVHLEVGEDIEGGLVAAVAVALKAALKDGFEVGFDVGPQRTELRDGEVEDVAA